MNSTKCEDPGKNLGIASMILGFVALGTQLLGIFSGVSLPAAIAAVICGFIGKNRSAQEGLVNSNAKTGVICGFTGIVINILLTVLSLIISFGIIALYFVFIFLMLVAGGM